MSSLSTERHGFGSAMRDFGTVLFAAVVGTINGVIWLFLYEGDPFWLWASAVMLWGSGAWRDTGFLDGRNDALPHAHSPRVSPGSARSGRAQIT